MKSLRISLLCLFLVCFAQLSFAQTKKETFRVSGECGMCKTKIEAAAKKAGATKASWDTETKVLTVSYNSTSSNTAKIQKSIAATGYDTPGFKANEEAYSKLHACCKYDRADASACCDNAACVKASCMKDGKCAPSSACCAEAGCDKKDCCKKD
jgi:mercuric ion binding protein